MLIFESKKFEFSGFDIPVSESHTPLLKVTDLFLKSSNEM